MGVWEDTFGAGSRFQRVFWVAPIFSVLVITIIVGGPAALLIGLIYGVTFMVLNYAFSGAPALVAWFVTFRLGRLIGASRAGAGILAAPVMALAASPVACLIIATKFSRTVGPDLDLAYQYFWIVAPTSMVVSFLVAVVGGSADASGASRRSAWPQEARRWTDAEDGRLR